MRFLLVAAWPAILLGQGGVVEGTVTNSVTHAGIEGVEVTMQSTAARNDQSYTATTDASGGFRIEGVPDGDFRAGFGKPGFMPVGIGLPGPGPIHVSAADGPLHMQFVLAPFPKLRGRVIDGEGHPVPDANVELIHIGGGGRPRATSGKDGAFVFEQMLQGAFVLRAVPPAKFQRPKSPADEPQIWAPTYYPSVTEQFRAERTALRGGDVDGYDIKLCAVPVFHARGVVVDDYGKPVAGATLKLISPDSLDARSHAAFEEPEGQVKSADDGTFEFPAVRPGEWYLMANGNRGGKALSGVVTGMVSKGDWENIKVHVTTPFTVKGTVERPDARNAASSHHTWVGLIPGWQIRLMGIHDESGAFEIDDVVPGKYQILLEQPLPGQYVDTVQFGGRDVLGQTVDVMDASLHLRVVYKADGGRVQGSAEQCSRGTVVLMPKEPALQNGEMIRTGGCDKSGRFDIGNLRPGAYYAAAFERMEMPDLSYGLYYGGVVDPALIAEVTERGAIVRVESGQTATVALKLTAWPEQ